MGRGFNFATCLEGALKVKELTYRISKYPMSQRLSKPEVDKESMRVDETDSSDDDEDAQINEWRLVTKTQKPKTGQ